MKYVAEFKKEYNHNTNKLEWKAKNLFEVVSVTKENENPPFYRADEDYLHSLIDNSETMAKSAVEYVLKINTDEYAYKIVNPTDVEKIDLKSSAINLSIFNKNFDLYEDYIKE
ncbi:MAG: hypothetical protein KBS62_00195 [Oscillospiraceae bacterium]|nr:hypothetical protein [Candidatus Ruminococcus equi]